MFLSPVKVRPTRCPVNSLHRHGSTISRTSMYYNNGSNASGSGNGSIDHPPRVLPQPEQRRSRPLEWMALQTTTIRSFWSGSSDSSSKNNSVLTASTTNTPIVVFNGNIPNHHQRRLNSNNKSKSRHVKMILLVVTAGLGWLTIGILRISFRIMIYHTDDTKNTNKHNRYYIQQQQSVSITRNNKDDETQRSPMAYLRKIQSILVEKKLISFSVPTNTKTDMDSSSTSNSIRTVEQKKEETIITDNDYFIIFDADLMGQGTGNLISGLLAAHLMGDEFNRIVCVNPKYYANFLNAFESINPIVNRKCPILLQRVNTEGYKQQQHQNSIMVVNFMGAANECELQNFMSHRNNQPIVHFIGNTYPRWPPVPDYYFLHHYQPKQILLQTLPYSVQPRTVVHLREPDDIALDPRAGLDDASLTALGELLPNNNTYLVTNNVYFYTRFMNCCGWTHPIWDDVKHSAFWGMEDGGYNTKEQQQNLQMWSDWYTLLMADVVYHTHSDFSISAIHWMNNRKSYSIRGYNTTSRQLETAIESWWYDGETIPLVQRTRQGKAGTTNELRACNI